VHLWNVGVSRNFEGAQLSCRYE